MGAPGHADSYPQPRVRRLHLRAGGPANQYPCLRVQLHY